MKLSHRIRMHILLRKADALQRKADARRAHMNRPHEPSVHLVGWPHEDESIGHTAPGKFYAAVIAIGLGLLLYLNVFHHDAQPATQPVTCMASK